MNKMTKKEKFKKFVEDHHDTIVKVTVYTALAVGVIAIITRARSEEQERLERTEKRSAWVEKENEWLDEKTAEGKDVYLLHDLTYLFITKDTEREWIKDRVQKPK